MLEKERGRLQKVGAFRSQALKANLAGSCSGPWSHSEPPFSEVSAVLQAVHAPGQRGRDHTVSAGLGQSCGRKQEVSAAVLTCTPFPVRFEKLAQDRKQQLEILQLAQAQGLDPPIHHFELKTFQTVRCQSLRETVAPCRTGQEAGSQGWRLGPLE